MQISSDPMATAKVARHIEARYPSGTTVRVYETHAHVRYVATGRVIDDANIALERDYDVRVLVDHAQPSASRNPVVADQTLLVHFALLVRVEADVEVTAEYVRLMSQMPRRVRVLRDVLVAGGIRQPEAWRPDRPSVYNVGRHGRFFGAEELLAALKEYSGTAGVPGHEFTRATLDIDLVRPWVREMLAQASVIVLETARAVWIARADDFHGEDPRRWTLAAAPVAYRAHGAVCADAPADGCDAYESGQEPRGGTEAHAAELQARGVAAPSEKQHSLVVTEHDLEHMLHVNWAGVRDVHVRYAPASVHPPGTSVPAGSDSGIDAIRRLAEAQGNYLGVGGRLHDRLRKLRINELTVAQKRVNWIRKARTPQPREHQARLEGNLDLARARLLAVGFPDTGRYSPEVIDGVAVAAREALLNLQQASAFALELPPNGSTDDHWRVLLPHARWIVELANSELTRVFRGAVVTQVLTDTSGSQHEDIERAEAAAASSVAPEEAAILRAERLLSAWATRVEHESPHAWRSTVMHACITGRLPNITTVEALEKHAKRLEPLLEHYDLSFSEAGRTLSEASGEPVFTIEQRAELIQALKSMRSTLLEMRQLDDAYRKQETEHMLRNWCIWASDAPLQANGQPALAPLPPPFAYDAHYLQFAEPTEDGDQTESMIVARETRELLGSSNWQRRAMAQMPQLEAALTVARNVILGAVSARRYDQLGLVVDHAPPATLSAMHASATGGPVISDAIGLLRSAFEETTDGGARAYMDATYPQPVNTTTPDVLVYSLPAYSAGLRLHVTLELATTVDTRQASALSAGMTIGERTALAEEHDQTAYASGETVGTQRARALARAYSPIANSVLLAERYTVVQPTFDTGFWNFLDGGDSERSPAWGVSDGSPDPEASVGPTAEEAARAAEVTRVVLLPPRTPSTDAKGKGPASPTLRTVVPRVPKQVSVVPQVPKQVSRAPRAPRTALPTLAGSSSSSSGAQPLTSELAFYTSYNTRVEELKRLRRPFVIFEPAPGKYLPAATTGLVQSELSAVASRMNVFLAFLQATGALTRERGWDNPDVPNARQTAYALRYVGLDAHMTVSRIRVDSTRRPQRATRKAYEATLANFDVSSEYRALRGVRDSSAPHVETTLREVAAALRSLGQNTWAFVDTLGRRGAFMLRANGDVGFTVAGALPPDTGGSTTLTIDDDAGLFRMLAGTSITENTTIKIVLVRRHLEEDGGTAAADSGAKEEAARMAARRKQEDAERARRENARAAREAAKAAAREAAKAAREAAKASKAAAAKAEVERATNRVIAKLEAQKVAGDAGRRAEAAAALTAAGAAADAAEAKAAAALATAAAEAKAAADAAARREMDRRAAAAAVRAEAEHVRKLSLAEDMRADTTGFNALMHLALKTVRVAAPPDLPEAALYGLALDESTFTVLRATAPQEIRDGGTAALVKWASASAISEFHLARRDETETNLALEDFVLLEPGSGKPLLIFLRVTAAAWSELTRNKPQPQPAYVLLQGAERQQLATYGTHGEYCRALARTLRELRAAGDEHAYTRTQRLSRIPEWTAPAHERVWPLLFTVHPCVTRLAAEAAPEGVTQGVPTEFGAHASTLFGHQDILRSRFATQLLTGLGGSGRASDARTAGARVVAPDDDWQVAALNDYADWNMPVFDSQSSVLARLPKPAGYTGALAAADDAFRSIGLDPRQTDVPGSTADLLAQLPLDADRFLAAGTTAAHVGKCVASDVWRIHCYGTCGHKSTGDVGRADLARLLRTHTRGTGFQLLTDAGGGADHVADTLARVALRLNALRLQSVWVRRGHVHRELMHLAVSTPRTSPLTGQAPLLPHARVMLLLLKLLQQRVGARAELWIGRKRVTALFAGTGAAYAAVLAGGRGGVVNLRREGASFLETQVGVSLSWRTANASVAWAVGCIGEEDEEESGVGTYAITVEPEH